MSATTAKQRTQHEPQEAAAAAAIAAAVAAAAPTKTAAAKSISRERPQWAVLILSPANAAAIVLSVNV